MDGVVWYWVVLLGLGGWFLLCLNVVGVFLIYGWAQRRRFEQAAAEVFSELEKIQNGDPE